MRQLLYVCLDGLGDDPVPELDGSTPLIYVCLDGLGDDPIPELDGRTPLEAAETPNLDALASRGRTGTVLTVGPGIAALEATS